MIRRIRFADDRGRDGLVALAPPARATRPDRRGPTGDPVRFERIVKAPLERVYVALHRSYPDDDSLARALVDGDPEIDLEAAGRIAGPCDRVWVDPDGAPLYAVTMTEIVYGPDGTEKERRAPLDIPANIGEDLPLRWTGRFFRREEIARRFAITAQYHVLHTDGLTFEFLFRMAAMLERKDALVSVGAGQNGREPLILKRNGTPHRAFLEGRTNGEKYLLVLHLSDLELKRPPS